MVGNHKHNGWLIFSSTAIALLWIVMFVIYSFFSRRILVREEQNMMMSAQTVANSMEAIVNEQENLLNVYFNQYHIWLMQDDIEINLETLVRGSNEQTSRLATDIRYIPAEEMAFEKELFGTEEQQEQVLLQARSSDQVCVAGWSQKSAEEGYILYLVKAVLVQNDCAGYVLQGLSLNEIYNIAMSEVSIGETANYKMVDEQNRIVLHTQTEWVGFHLHEKMDALEAQEGEPAEKIEASAPVEIVGKPFYLILSVPRSDVMGDVNQMMVLLMALLFLFVLTAGILIYRERVRVDSEQHIRQQLTVERALNEANRKLQLRDDQAMNQDRLQTLGLLAGSMAHELNNAMTPIVIYSDLLLEGDATEEEIQEYAAQIRDSAQRCSDLVHNVLNYGRQEKEEFKRQFYNVIPVWENTVSMLRQVKPDHVEIQVQCDIKRAYLYGNDGAFQQSVVNLATNAMYAMRKDGGVLSLRLSKKEPGKLIVEVADNGEGMSAEVMKHIFEPFYTTKPKGEGTGLGLAIVKRLVERQNGMITVNGEQGVGTCFQMILPTYEFTGVPMNDRDIQEICARPLRVYLLDDEPNVNRALQQTLVKTHWKIHSQTDPVRAYAELHDHLEEWDLLITDSVMPEMGGLELAELLRARRPELKILLITAYDDKKLEDYIERGIIDGFLYKPPQTKALLCKIAEIIDSKKFTKGS